MNWSVRAMAKTSWSAGVRKDVVVWSGDVCWKVGVLKISVITVILAYLQDIIP